ncbi:MAG: BMP family ABC transporter substrate-binding protein [Acidimicrobiales bacterium]|nr:BMP family ABC transporter substrate-binding protein [Acidimicrobiales bacterium]MCB9393392.1 BMP family ABC transporter substrate-binding protein [Acidimicrobiaceae bacterium]
MGAAMQRRQFLRLGALGALGVAGASVLAACGSDDDEESTSTSGAASPTTAASGSSAAPSGEALKVHFVYVGPPDDNGWTQAHDIARQAAESALGGAVETSFTPNIGFDASTTQLFEQLVADGYKMIVANTEYAGLMTGVADANPDVAFLECNGHHFTSNCFGYYMAHETTAYLMGVAAATLGASKIGYIGAFETATFFNDVNGLLLGARSVNPEATVQYVNVQTFFDPQKAAVAADALLSDGVDFLYGVMDEPTFLQKAEEAGVWTGYWNLDFRSAAPTKYVNNFDLTSFAPFYEEQFRALVDGTWKAPSEVVLLECPLGEWGPEVPQEVKDAVAAAAAELESGELSVYQGPLNDNQGNEVVPAGETIDALGAYSVGFAVEGVTGS